MTSDFSSRLNRLKEASKAKNEAETSFAKEWAEKKTIIESVLKETEQEFLLEEIDIMASEKSDSPILLVATKEVPLYELFFQPDWPSCNVVIKAKVLQGGGRDQERAHSLQEITEKFVQDQVEAFLRMALKL